VEDKVFPNLNNEEQGGSSYNETFSLFLLVESHGRNEDKNMDFPFEGARDNR